MNTEAEKKDITSMTRKEIEDWPDRGWNKDIGVFDSLIILPTRRIHDSGYRCMDFVAVRDNMPVCRLSGCSDVVHIDGIGGYGHRGFRDGMGLPILVPPKMWSIDCLKVSGLLRLFSHEKLSAGAALSSFEIYSVPKDKADKIQ
jgi:hypothetical protein